MSQISSSANYTIENLSEARVEIPEVMAKDGEVVFKRQVLGPKADSKMIGALPYTVTVTGKVLTELVKCNVFNALHTQGLIDASRGGGGLVLG